MKWTLIVVGLIGAVAYAVIFFAQAQHDARQSSAVSVDVPTGSEVVERGISDLPGLAGGLDSAVVVVTAGTDAIARPTWEGSAWVAGVQAFERGELELARAALEVAVNEQENAPYRHYLLGLTYRRLGVDDLARAELERSVELAPGEVRALVNLARVHLDLEDPVRAREAIDDALEIDLDHADSWQVLGRIELAEGNLEEAAAAFAKAVVKDPQHAWAWNNLGYARIQQERFVEAVEPLRRALATGVEEAVFYNNLGVALERTGHDELALTAFGRAALLGHGVAEASLDRLETILVARGAAVPSFDLIESLDAVQMAALVASIEVETALDEPLRADEFEGAGVVLGRQ